MKPRNKKILFVILWNDSVIFLKLNFEQRILIFGGGSYKKWFDQL